ncbi:MAG: ATP-binding protein, partial [Bacteroidota bacterium]
GIGLGFLCWAALELTSHSVFGQFDVSASSQHESYIFNFTITLVFVSIIAYYFQGLSNRQVDDIITRAQRELKAVFDNSFDAIFLVSLGSHEITSANERSLEMFGIAERQSFIGKLINDMRAEPLSLDELVAIEERLQSGARWSSETQFRKADDSIFWGSVAYTFVKYGEKQELLVRITDVSEQKAAELAIIEAKEKAEEANRAKDNFMANMSHEIRTPINGIIGLAEIIEAEAEDDELQSYADLVLESGHRLLRTLGSILDLTRLEAQDVNLAVEPLSIKDLFESIDASWRDEATEQGLYLEITEPQSSQAPMLNKAFIEQSLGHIISNAIKFTDQGGVSIWSEVDPSDPEAPSLKIIVADTGIGMSEKFINKKLFMKFEQESDGLDRNYEGSGLGLSIVKRVVELMQGEIEVQSVKGEGSQFILSFPLPELIPATH